MSLINADYKGTTLDRVLAAGIVRMSLQDMRETEAKEDGNGEPSKGPISKTIINLVLEQPHKTVDGEELRPGIPVATNIAEWPNDPERGKQQMKELALAALGLDRAVHKSKDDWLETLANRGGWTGLKGSHLLVEWTVDKRGFNQVKHWNRVPPQPAPTA